MSLTFKGSEDVCKIIIFCIFCLKIGGRGVQASTGPLSLNSDPYGHIVSKKRSFK